MFLELNFGAADAVDNYLPPKMLELEEACPLQSPVPSVICAPNICFLQSHMAVGKPSITKNNGPGPM